MFSRFLRLAMLLPAVMLATGCASSGPTTVMQLNPRGCATQWDLSSPQAIVLDAPGGAQSHRIDGDTHCLAQPDGVAASYAVYRLPRFRESWTLQLESLITGGGLFAPEALLLDAQGKVLREVAFDRFALRGDRLQTTVFFSQDNAAEQYLLVQSAGAVVGRDERRVVSGSFIVPLLAGALPFLYMQGTESEGSFTYSHSGTINLLARSQGAPLRRNAHVRAMARSELGAFTR